jgi:predicted acyltransferase (DUF342 family)
MYENRDKKMDTDRYPSEWRFYGIGVCVIDKEPDTHELIVSPLETLNNVGENLTTYEKRISIHLKDFRRETSVSIVKYAKVKAIWYNQADDTRVTSPDIIRGELVDLFRLGDKELWYWNVRGKTQLYRRLEHINWQYNNTPDRNEDADEKSKYYQFFMSTRDKFIRLITADNDDEPCIWDFVLNTKKAIYSIVDGSCMNSIHWEATKRLITHTFNLIVFEAMLFVRGNTSINDNFLIRSNTGNSRTKGFFIVDKQLYVNGSINSGGSIRTTGTVEAVKIKTLDIGANSVRCNTVLCGAAMFGYAYTGVIGVPATTPELDAEGNVPEPSEDGVTTPPLDPPTVIDSDGTIKSRIRAELTGSILTDDVEATGTIDVAEDVNTAGNNTVGGNSEVTGDSSTGGNGTITGNSTVGGNSEVTGNSTVGGNGTITGNTTVGGRSEVTGDSSTGGNGVIGGNSEVGGNLFVSGAATIGGDLTVSGAFINAGYSTLSDQVGTNVTSIATLTKNLSDQADAQTAALAQQARDQADALSQQASSVGSLESTVNSNKNSISSNKDSISTLNSKVSALESNVATLQKKLATLQAKVDAL